MRRNRNIRIVLTVALGLLAAGPCSRKAQAQLAVFDPLQTAQSMIDALQQLTSTLDQLDVIDEQLFDFKGMKEWFDKSFGEGSTYARMKDFAQDLQMLDRMTRSLNMQMKMTEQYALMLKEWQNYGYNPNMVTAMINQVNYSLQSVKRLIDQADKILRDTGLTRAEKKQEVDRQILKIDQESYVQRMLLEYEMQTLEEARAALQFDNFLAGRSPDDGLQVVGSGAGTGEAVVRETLVETPEGSVSVDQAVGDAADSARLAGAGRNGFRLVSLLTALLCVMSIIGAFVRYAGGDPGGEKVFVRIAVAAAAVSAALAVLTRFVGL